MKAIQKTKSKKLLSERVTAMERDPRGALATWGRRMAGRTRSIFIVLRHGILSLYSYIRKFVPWRSRTYIQNLRHVRIAGVTSSFLFGLLALAIIIPLYNVSGTEDTEAATGTAIDSSITFTSTRNTATVDLTPTSVSGTFASSTSGTTDAAFSITTTNSQGYELKIKSTSGTVLKPTTTTSDSDGLSTITTSGITSSSFTNNTWGYLPNYYNCNEANGTCTTNTTNYYPATTSDVTLRKTTSANTTAHNYTIGLGAKANLTKTSGTYTLGGNKGSLVLTYVANPTAYSITFNKGNTTDTVSNMPYSSTNNNVSGSVSATSITITDGIPTRTGYDFKGWCTVLPTTTNGVDSCKNSAGTTGTTYNATGATSWSYGIDRTSSNTVTLYAMWSKATVNVTVNFAGSGVTGVTFTNATYGNVTVSTSGNTAALKYGVQYDITGTYSSGYEFSSWAATAGSLGSTTSASTTYSTTTAATLTLTGKSSCSTITFKTSNASSIVFNGTSYTNNQTACVANGTYSIYGTYATKYAWKSWSATAGSFGNSAYQNTTYTVTGNATITLTGQSVTLAMQNLSSSNCTTTARPVYDTRDNSVYWVQKLADDKCWMLDNLALDLTSPTIVNSLSTRNTNLNSTALDYFKNGGGSTSDSHPTAAYTNWTSSYSYSQPMINASNKDKVLVSMDAPDTPNHTKGAYGPGQGKVGVYYNYCAASVGSYCYGNGTSEGTTYGNNPFDVCPAGWRMPTGNTSGNYNALYTNSAIGSNATNYRNALSTPLSGFFSNGSASNQGSYGAFWSSVRSSNSSMYRLYVSPSSVYPTDNRNRYYGNSVRCVLEPTTLTVNFGTGIAGVIVKDSSPEGATIGTITTSGGSVDISSSINYYLLPLYNSGYTFSYLTPSGGISYSGTYGYYYYIPTRGTSNTVTVSATTLATTSSTNMQNLSISNCPAYPKAVKDTRDSEVYYVQRLADGKCWMLENLRLDLVAKKSSLTTSNTNVNSTSLTSLKSGNRSAGNQYATAGVANWTSGESYSAPLVNISNKTTTVTGYGPGRNYVGAYYNYCAASAGSYCYGNGTSYGTSSGNASYDICPAGWRMPTGNTSGEYDTLYAAYSSDVSNFRIALSTPLSGYFYSGSADFQGSYGFFWSSTRYNNDLMHLLTVDSSNVSPPNLRNRNFGTSVRCVLK